MRGDTLACAWSLAIRRQRFAVISGYDTRILPELLFDRSFRDRVPVSSPPSAIMRLPLPMGKRRKWRRGISRVWWRNRRRCGRSLGVKGTSPGPPAVRPCGRGHVPGLSPSLSGLPGGDINLRNVVETVDFSPLYSGPHATDGPRNEHGPEGTFPREPPISLCPLADSGLASGNGQ